MANYETKLSFGVDIKGAKSAQQQLDELNKAAVENAKKQKAQATVTADALAKIAEEAKAAADAIAQNGRREDSEHKKKVKAARDYAKERVKAANDAGRAQEAAIKKVARLEEQEHRAGLRRAASQERDTERLAQKAKTPQAVTATARGAFSQGFIQGAMPGDLSRFIDRGPGGFRQAAGITAGSALSSLASIPFTGVGGIMGAAGAVGSVLSAPLERMFGNVGSGLSRQRNQLGMAPYLGQYGMQQMFGTGGIANLTDEQLHTRAVQEAVLSGKNSMRDAQGRSILAALGKGSTDIGPYLTMARAGQTQGSRTVSAEARLSAQRERDRNSDGGDNPLRRLGERYAMNLGETQQMATQMAMRAGGQAEGLGQKGLIETGVAASRRYGVGADVAGAFGRAGDIGGIVGGGGDSAGFARMIGSAVNLGLKGSDLTRAAEQMAQILGNFESSGIPLAQGAIGSAAAGFAKMGFSPAMAQSAGAGVTQSIQAIGDAGPQDAFSMAAIQALGGGNSYAGQLTAMEQMRNPTAQTISKIFAGLGKRVINRGQGAVGREEVRTLLKRFNIAPSRDNVDRVSESFGRGNYDITGSLGRTLSPEEIQAAGQSLTPGVLSQQSAAENRKAGLGEQGAAASLSADALADNVARGFASVISPTLGGLTRALNGLVGFLDGHMGSGPAARAAGAARSGDGG